MYTSYLVISIVLLNRMSEFAMKLTDIDSEQVGIPDTDYSAVIKMPSTEFARVCRDLSNFGESITICVTKDGLKFSVKGDSSNGKSRSLSGHHYDEFNAWFLFSWLSWFYGKPENCLAHNLVVFSP